MECRANDTEAADLVAGLDDAESRSAIIAERSTPECVAGWMLSAAGGVGPHRTRRN